MAAAAAEAIWLAGSEVAPANHAVEGPAEGLLYEAPLTLVGIAAKTEPIVAARATRRTENRLRDIMYVQYGWLMGISPVDGSEG